MIPESVRGELIPTTRKSKTKRVADGLERYMGESTKSKWDVGAELY